MKRRLSINEAFWDRIKRTEYCWLWKGPIIPRGYGKFYVNGVFTYAHRFSYEFHKGPIELGNQVNHTCDNPNCVNPDHLYQGAQKENARDKTIRERACRLSSKQVLEIRKRYAEGNCTWRSLAKEYGVTKTHIGWIIHRKTWKHLP